LNLDDEPLPCRQLSPSRRRSGSSRRVATGLAFAAILVSAIAVEMNQPERGPRPADPAPALVAAETPSETRLAALPAAPPQTVAPDLAPPADTRFQSASPPPAILPAAPPEAPTDRVPDAVLSQSVPLPVPRPADLTPDARPADPARAPEQRSASISPVPAPTEDGGSLFDRLLGIFKGGRPNLAEFGPATAVYDITAKVVYMPGGETLEAHSGLGESLDDPNKVHVRMRGPTPPGIYDLKERERLFHGVRAIRLNPVGGPAAIHGRAGLLAHTFMLGPRGDSNGCVSFKDYDRFLQAYLRGDVQRLVVLAGDGREQKIASAAPQ
jgi:hypothetical protein